MKTSICLLSIEIIRQGKCALGAIIEDELTQVIMAWRGFKLVLLQTKLVIISSKS